MATATLLNPAPHYQNYQPPYSNYSHPAASSSMPGIISPVEPRRISDDTEPQRQSLPSIQEVISGTKPSAPAFPPPLSTSVSGPPSLPSPFASSASSRPFADLSPQDRHSSPRSAHNPASFPAREPMPQPMPPFSDPSRPPLSVRPPAPPPLNTYHPGARPSPPPLKMESRGAERQADSHRMNGSYTHSAASEQSSLPYPQPGQLPPGQLPLSAHPVSPRHGAPSLPSPYDGSRSSMHEDADYMRRENKYEQTLSRHFEAWQYQESLAKIASGSRTIFNFADAYGRCAAEEQGPGSHPMPTRLPSEREIGDMLNMAEWMKGMLDGLRTMVQQSAVMNDRAREASRGKGPYEDEEMAMYGDGMKSAYEMAGVKKRRGRAAPPGRCHSCNRIDTPEWRRGPDGARTLCNACGLHYAKLERKKQIDAKNQSFHDFRASIAPVTVPTEAARTSP
ncbi:hypothetical protein VPNG_08143 [Cytospora leucostoma]|uniref:GATA-type domain-containing protein n=1 Tax=Cytospora leucostoma TaxID=1230097 RepID=A0A423WIC7_9PEZI|nr:hypothetical protein VPNG_08143 [Cytospora leucostoma]